MKCPKCQYITFGSATRCRNCGYEFSLASDAAAFDLPIQTGDEPLGPLGDLPLKASGGGSAAAARTPPADEPAASFRAAAVSRLDLPLFEESPDVDDTPLVDPTAAPRPPLSVRRGAPAITRPRHRATPAPDVLQFDLAPASPVGSRTPGGSDVTENPQTGRMPSVDPAAAPAASAVSRLSAGMIDLTILGSIDLAVVYFTLRLLELGPADVVLLPAVPLVTFLLILNGGYLVIFTAAGGQTIGKMTTGIRVVAQIEHGETYSRVSFATAAVRAASYLASLLPAGLGFAPIVFSPDGRTLHDRLSDTRVVRA